MKTSQTKAQRVVNNLYGPGVYIVKDDDLDRLATYFEEVLSELLSPDYIEAVVKYIKGEELSGTEKQRNFHALSNLSIAITQVDSLPTFLQEVEYPEDKQWTLADLGEVLFGVRGDPKVYSREFSPPANGDFYTTEEVKAIVEMS